MSDDDEDVLQRRAGEDDESVLLPAFINKLLKMLADPECTDTIQYGSDGTTLLVVDSSLFATVLAPILSPFPFPRVLNHLVRCPESITTIFQAQQLCVFRTSAKCQFQSTFCTNVRA